MSPARAVAAATLLAALAASGGCGARRAGGPVAVRDAWVRASTPGASAGAAYLVLTSPGGDRLVGVAVPESVARFAQVHETVRTPGPGGTSSLGMRHVAAVDLPAGREVAFSPGERHVMLIALARPLVPGDTVRLALAFAHAPAETIAAPVRNE